MIKVIVASVFMCLLFFSVPAAAHVLIPDTSQSGGAILHIIPDDDPIAGQQSTLYFDTQQDLLQQGNSTATLTVTDTKGSMSTVATTIDDTLITATYTFATQGIYKLVFTITSGDKQHIFEQSQRVSRGTVGSPLDTPSYVWAEMLAIVSFAGLCATIITALVRRKAIARQSVL